jgi:hypothetical protein
MGIAHDNDRHSAAGYGYNSRNLNMHPSTFEYLKPTDE